MPKLYTKEQLQGWYQAGDINARQYNIGMRQLASDSLEEQLRQKGFILGTLAQIHNDWNDRIEKITQDLETKRKIEGIQNEFRKTGKMPDALFSTPESTFTQIWNDIKTGVSMVGEVGRASGKTLARSVAAWGAGPTTQKLVEIAGDAAVNTMLTGKGVTDMQQLLGLGAKKTVGALKAGLSAVIDQPQAAAKVSEAAPAIAGEGANLINPLAQEAKAAWEQALSPAPPRNNIVELGKIPKSRSTQDILAEMENRFRIEHAQNQLRDVQQFGVNVTAERAAREDALNPLAAGSRNDIAGLIRGESNDVGGDFSKLLDKIIYSNWVGISQEETAAMLKWMDQRGELKRLFTNENYRKAKAWSESIIPTRSLPQQTPVPSQSGREIIAQLPDITAKKAAGEAGTAASHATTLERAQQFATPNLADVANLPPNTMLSAERGVKVREAFREPLQRLWKLLPDVAAGNPEAQLVFDAELVNMAPALGSHKAMSTVAGRAGDIQKISPNHGLLNQIYDTMSAFAPEAAASGNWAAVRQKMAQHLIDLGSPEWVDDFFVQTEKALAGEAAGGRTWGDLVRQAYMTTLLAQPRTWIKKGLGDVTGAFDKTMQTAFAGWLSKNAENGVLMSDGPLAAKTMLQAMRHVMGSAQPEFAGAVEAKNILNYAEANLNPAAVAELKAAAPRGFFELKGDPPNWAVPQRVFNGMTDAVQRVGALFGQYMEAGRVATREALTGDAWTSRVADLMNAPTKDMLMQGVKVMGDMTYTEPLGAIGKFIQQNLQRGPGFALFPFMHIPMNLTNRSISNIPGLSLLSRGLVKDLEAGGVAGDMAMGRLGWGYLTSQYYWLMAKAGMITGSGPLDPKEREVWLKDHRPYSIKAGDGTWIPYGWAEPVSKQMSLLADIAYYSDYVDQGNLTTLLASTAAAATKDILGTSSYWETFTRIANVTEKTGRGALEMLGEAAKEAFSTPVAALTGGPAAATMARGMDPYYKAIDNFWDDTKSRIPILRGSVPNRINPLTGEPEQYPVPWGAGWLAKMMPEGEARGVAGILTPFESATVTKDPIIQEMERVGAKFPSFRQAQGTQPAIAGGAVEPGQAPPVSLNDAEMSDLMRIYGKRKFDGEKRVRDVLQEMVDDPGYKKMPTASKKDAIESVLRANAVPAFEEFKAKNLEDIRKADGNVEDSVAYRYAASGLKKMMDKAPAADQAQMQTEYMSALNQQMQSEQQFNQAQQDYLDHNQPPYPVAPSE